MKSTATIICLIMMTGLAFGLLTGQSNCLSQNESLVSFAINMYPNSMFPSTPPQALSYSVKLIRGYYYFQRATVSGTRISETGREVSVSIDFPGPYYVPFEFKDVCERPSQLPPQPAGGGISGCGAGPILSTLQASEGVYAQAELSYSRDSTSYYFIRMEGIVTDLKSGKSNNLVVMVDYPNYTFGLNNGDATVSMSQLNTITINFDPTMLFDGVDWSLATPISGTYTVSVSSNAAVLSKFLANLSKYSRMFNDINGDGLPD